MFRGELKYTDKELILLIKQGYGINVDHLKFIDSGSFFGFIIKRKNDKDLFLKVYPEQSLLDPTQPSIEDLNKIGSALKQFREQYGLTKISNCVAREGEFCFKIARLLLVIYEHIEGYHPTYHPNQLNAKKLAKILWQLHQIPPTEFPFFEKETFDISYAGGLLGWINNEKKATNTTYSDEILRFLARHSLQIKTRMSELNEWQKEYLSKEAHFVLTHGDAHHFNVLQTSYAVWLVDWDSVKRAPVERDLWHYENAPLIKEYQNFNQTYTLDHKLCRFYQIQRFFEDIRYYTEQILLSKNSTREQDQMDKESLFHHWGWELCLA